MKKLIKSILLGAIIPLLFFIVGQKGNLKHVENPCYGWAWAFIVVVWILATLAVHKLILDRSDSKKDQGIKSKP